MTRCVGLQLVYMPPLIEAFGKIILLNIYLHADRPTITVSDCIQLGGAERPFYRRSIILSIVVVGIGLIESVINIQALDLGGNPDNKVAAGYPFGHEDNVVGAAGILDVCGIHPSEFGLHALREV